MPFVYFSSPQPDYEEDEVLWEAAQCPEENTGKGAYLPPEKQSKNLRKQEKIEENEWLD